MKLVTLISGGLDSTVLAYMLADLQHAQTLLFINYGQKHLKESLSAKICADALGLRLKHVTITGQVIFKSALTTSEIEITQDETTTVVPNRNSVMANLAAALAISMDYDGIALGIQQGDSPTYPDCRPEFVVALERLLTIATGGPLSVVTPFLYASKGEIVDLGAELGVPFKETWSCYVGGELHCGVCSACKGRKAAFEAAGVHDSTEYVK